jgi:hypothetical protein
MKTQAFGLVVSLGLGVVGIALAQQVGGPGEPTKPVPLDNGEVARLYEDDQTDRSPKDGSAIDPAILIPRDRDREARIKALYRVSKVRTGKDYYRAAMILQHANEPEDYLLAHEFCIVALAKGEPKARWLAAASEDRFLMKIGRSQRFGTQYHSSKLEDPVRLYNIEPGVTDALRSELGVPTLEEARKREAEMNEVFKVKTP